VAFVPLLAVAAAGVSAVGAVEGGIASKNAADYQAQVAANNSQIANQNATYAMESGEAQAANQSRKGAANLGQIKVKQAASGVDVNSGSAVDVQAGQRETNQLDTETVLNNSELQAYGYRTQSTNFQAQSGLDTMQGEQAEEAGYLKAGGDLLSGASGVGGKWTGLTSNNLGSSLMGGGSPSGYGTGTS
jgi:DNA-binding helix-hairpin-helix protein with protein kinase domain